MSSFKRVNVIAIIALLLRGELALGFDSRSCLVEEVVDLNPTEIRDHGKDYYQVKDGKVWVFSSVKNGNAQQSIIHIWSRNGQDVDTISRPILYNNGMFSYKSLTPDHLGIWEQRTIDHDGRVLGRITLEIVEKENDFFVYTKSVDDLSCSEEIMKEQINEALAEEQADTNEQEIHLPIQKNEEQYKQKNWFVGAEGGISSPLFEMKDDLNIGSSFGVFVGRRLKVFHTNGMIRLNIDHSRYSKYKAIQDNSANDTNLSVYYLYSWKLSSQIDMNFGGGAGFSRWRAYATNKATNIESSNSGFDPSLDLNLGGAYRFYDAYSLTLNIKARQVFGDFSEMYLPITLGLSYDFGGEL